MCFSSAVCAEKAQSSSHQSSCSGLALCVLPAGQRCCRSGVKMGQCVGRLKHVCFCGRKLSGPARVVFTCKPLSDAVNI